MSYFFFSKFPLSMDFNEWFWMCGLRQPWLLPFRLRDAAAAGSVRTVGKLSKEALLYKVPCVSLDCSSMQRDVFQWLYKQAWPGFKMLLWFPPLHAEFDNIDPSSTKGKPLLFPTHRISSCVVCTLVRNPSRYDWRFFLDEEMYAELFMLEESLSDGHCWYWLPPWNSTN